MTVLSVLLLLMQYDLNLYDLCGLWNQVYRKIQYGTVDRKMAGKALQKIINEIHDRVSLPADSVFYFPVEGYGLPDVGGGGKGFIPRKYNFLHGNVHRGHPAHDIFIKDRDMDCLDDATKKPVRILAMAGGIVVGMKTDWAVGDSLRSGNFVMIYNPPLRRYYYYAHNDSVFINIGDFVTAGTPIATVGRTGRSANMTRSPTHLHLMVLKVTPEKSEPYNYYDELKKSVFTTTN